MIKLGAKELRTTIVGEDQKGHLKKNPLYIICDNILDTYNVGSIFRLAEAVAAKQVILCGVTETPPNTRIKKASINTTEWVDWVYCEHTVDSIVKLRTDIPGIHVVAIEQDTKSVAYTNVHYDFPLALVIGNETTGISQEVLAVVDKVVELPMWGVNKSLNVMVSLGIVLYETMKFLKETKK